MRVVCCRVALLALVSLAAARCAASPSGDGTVPGAVVAGSAPGESCAAKLSPDASSIYRAAVPDMRRDTDLPSLLREKVMPMVASDQIELSAARPAAEQAAACLEQLRR